MSTPLVKHGCLQGGQQGCWGQRQGNSTGCFMTTDMELHEHVTILKQVTCAEPPLEFMDRQKNPNIRVLKTQTPEMLEGEQGAHQAKGLGGRAL